MTISFLEDISQFKQWQSELPEVNGLFEIQNDFKQKLARWKEQEQCLSIGVMGQVKAGKSSFLNALLFDGKPILPAAATPKTANLTRISYGEQFALRVEYYSQNEWQLIVKEAQGKGEHTEAKVARELVKMASKVGDKLEQCLKIGVERFQVDNLESLQGVLNQYTGNDGEFTPLVKCTEITLPLEELRGLEVVDTPGMNDPVQSRTQKTRDYMANCDVVFFLSHSSKFLDQPDVDLLATQLPGKGVKHMVLVAVQFDSAILDDGFNRDSLAETEANLKKRLGGNAQKQLMELVKRKQDSGNKAAADLLNNLTVPIFASTFAHGFAHWPQSRWSKNMKHVHAELLELAEDEWDDTITHEDWLRIANFSELTQAYECARENRITLLKAQHDGVIPDAVLQYEQQLTLIAKSAQARVKHLQTEDVASLELKKANCEKHIAELSVRLSRVLNAAQRQAQQMSDDLMQQIRQDKEGYSHLNEKTGTTTRTRSHEVSDSTWYKPWSWGSTRTVYSTYSENYQYLSSADAAEQIRLFGKNSARQVTARFAELIAPKQLKLELKKALLDALDTRSEQFDPMQFRTTLEQSLVSLQMPRLDVDLGDTTSLIGGSFSGDVQGADEMKRLRSSLNQALRAIMERFESCFQEQFQVVMQQLDLVEQTLTERLIKDVKAELNTLQLKVENKEAELKYYNSLLVLTSESLLSTTEIKGKIAETA